MNFIKTVRIISKFTKSTLQKITMINYENTGIQIPPILSSYPGKSNLLPQKNFELFSLLFPSSGSKKFLDLAIIDDNIHAVVDNAAIFDEDP